MGIFKKKAWPELEPLTDSEKENSRIFNLYRKYCEGIEADIHPNMINEISEELSTWRAQLRATKSEVDNDLRPA